MYYKDLPSLTTLFIVILLAVSSPLQANISLEDRLFTVDRIECGSPELDIRKITGRRIVAGHIWHIISSTEQPSINTKLIILEIVPETGGLDTKFFLVKHRVKQEINHLDFVREYDRYFPQEVRREFQTLWNDCATNHQ